jgi:hypothetical protein
MIAAASDLSFFFFTLLPMGRVGTRSVPRWGSSNNYNDHPHPHPLPTRGRGVQWGWP